MYNISIVGNGVISLLCQLQCHCNPDHDKFSSLSNTTVVAIFPNVCLWRRSLCSNLAGIDPEKLYRGTFICQYGLCCCIVWPSFLFVCFVKNWATCKYFLGKWFTPPPLPRGQKLPVRLSPSTQTFLGVSSRVPALLTSAYGQKHFQLRVVKLWKSRINTLQCAITPYAVNSGPHHASQNPFTTLMKLLPERLSVYVLKLSFEIWLWINKNILMFLLT